ncbi:class I SAM-dependent methyltransferase [Idiomarina ramblicola]|uniref:Uncharacterized protein n=1 Tax=Idiomarina ramblicola TaxID=263724 RepID=A0A432Z1P2_9GAMM|nr:class I SAM-dependent methyltransferase [Idiomarina ramblicola]RUO71791.1 hypothetical protein CWI78_04545 [Idiomarina ramblicola]
MNLKRPLKLNFNSDEKLLEPKGADASNLGNAHDEMRQYVDEVEKENSALKSELSVLKEENERLKNNSQSLEGLNQNLTELKSSLYENQEIRQKQLKSYIHKNMEVLKFFITKALTKNTKQVENFLSLERYLAEGEIPLNFHGWPISPDIALMMAGMFRNIHIDYVIEFGSGTSTVLFAKFFQRTDLRDKENRILSFEHDNRYLKETKNSIEEHGVGNLVELYYAPLKPLASSDSKRLYYDCNARLEEFKKRINQTKSHILILVDGPPGNLGEQSRFPAMEVILTYLSDHKLTFVIDDYQRDDEKEMVNRWAEILNKHSLSYELEEIELEKGGALLRVN